MHQSSHTLCEPLVAEDYVIQTLPDVSPTKWHLAHTSQLIETFVLASALPGYRPFPPRYNYLFNSYYIGVDLKKDPRLLHATYNDRAGVTARFNRNLLARINCEFGANFQLDRFAHYAFYHPGLGRIEMHLVSLADQRARIGDAALSVRHGESILTECSYKYTLDAFARLVEGAGFEVRRVRTDE